jgi:cytochrome P450
MQLSSAPGFLRRTLALAGYHATSFALSHPGPLRALFKLLRRLRPIAILGNTVWVANGASVREVLERFEDFTLGEVLGPRMPWGPFLLTLDWRQQHDRERALLRSMVLPEADVERIRQVAAARCQAVLAHAVADHAGRREIDLVQGLLEPVVMEVAASYFGIPPVARSEAQMMPILRHAAGIVMVEPPPGSRRRLETDASLDTLTRHITELIRARKQATVPAPPAPPAASESLLSRLVTRRCATSSVPAWLDDDFIRRYVTGLAATGAATIVRATTHVIDRLLARPHALARARLLAAQLDHDIAERDRIAADPRATPEEREKAARQLDSSRLRLRQIAYEALRFRPMLPLLVRYVPRDTVIGRGTPHARRVKAGSTVIAAALAVMFDPDEFDAPRHFFSTRPVEGFVHFGFGPRACFGKYVADTVMMEVVRIVTALPDLARFPGSAGRVAYDGPVAHSLVVTFRRPQPPPAPPTGAASP